VADAASVLEVIAGYDGDDPTTAWSVGQVTAYADGLEPNALEGARLGILRSFFGREAEHHEVNRVVENSIAAMRRLGAVPVELSVELDADELIANVSVSGFELDAHLSSYLARRGAPFSSLGDIVASGKYEPALKSLYEGALARSMDEPDYERRLRERLALRERVMQIMAAHRLDAIVYPHQKRLVVPIGEDQTERNGVLGAVTGFPAITVPAGFSSASASAPLGVPVGIEFLGRPFSDAALIRLAYAFEQATRYRRPPASTPPLTGSR